MPLKTCTKTMKRWGIYSPNTKLAVRAELAALTGNGRPARSTANGRKYDRWATAVNRPGRPKQTESRTLCSGRPPGRPKQTESRALRPGRPSGSTVPKVPNVHSFVHVGRLPGRPDWPDRHSIEQKTGFKIFLKIFYHL